MFFIHSAPLGIIAFGIVAGNAGTIESGHDNGQMFEAAAVFLINQPFFHIGKNRKIFIITAKPCKKAAPDKGRLMIYGVADKNSFGNESGQETISEEPSSLIYCVSP